MPALETEDMFILIAGIAALLLLAAYWQDYVRLRQRPQLPPLTSSDSASDGAQPFVSLVIPARNEAHTIGRCLDGALRQCYAPYEVIVVDDASTDATPAILAQYAARHTQLRIINSGALPPGWTGKAYACQQAASAARGEWLLFLDADTVPHPTLVAALVNTTQRITFDLLTVFPFLELGSFWERVVLPPFRAIIFATFPFERLNAPDVRPHEVAANGQCIFVRRASYAAIGGHEAVRAAVLEDVMLARAIRRAGYRTVAFDGGHHLRVRMYTNGHELLEGLMKNAAAGYASGGQRSFWIGMRQFVLSLAPLWLIFGGVALLAHDELLQGGVVLALALLASVAALGLWGAIMRQLYALSGLYALLWTFGLICYGIIVVWSLRQVRSGRGVIWKGRNYVGT